MTAEAVKQQQYVDVLVAGAVTELAVASTDVAYTQSVSLPRNCSFSLELLFESAGSVDVKVEVQHGNSAPGTEGATDPDFVTGDGLSAISSGITDENVHFLAFAPYVSQYHRLKLTGQGSNAATTKLTRCRINYSKND
jgi:hypothetical protein